MPMEKSATRIGVRRRGLQVIGTLALQGLVLLGSAGTWHWTMAWLVLAIDLLSILGSAVVMMRRAPELVAERSRVAADAKAWDRPLAGIVSLFGPLTTWIVAGLDRRLAGADALPVGLQAGALAAMAIGYAGWAWAMTSNPFFAGLVRIQHERGHHVVTDGPYQVVRHPGYAAMIVFTLAKAVALGSTWALLPATVTAAVAVVRTVMEDRALQQELAGYQEYARQVRYRLLPGVW